MEAFALIMMRGTFFCAACRATMKGTHPKGDKSVLYQIQSVETAGYFIRPVIAIGHTMPGYDPAHDRATSRAVFVHDNATCLARAKQLGMKRKKAKA